MNQQSAQLSLLFQDVSANLSIFDDEAFLEALAARDEPVFAAEFVPPALTIHLPAYDADDEFQEASVTFDPELHEELRACPAFDERMIVETLRLSNSLMRSAGEECLMTFPWWEDHSSLKYVTNPYVAKWAYIFGRLSGDRLRLVRGADGKENNYHFLLPFNSYSRFGFPSEIHCPVFRDEQPYIYPQARIAELGVNDVGAFFRNVLLQVDTSKLIFIGKEITPEVLRSCSLKKEQIDFMRTLIIPKKKKRTRR